MDTVLLLSLLAGLATGALCAWVLARGQFRRELTESISTHQATVSAAQALFHQTTRRLGEVQDELVRSRDDLERSRLEGSVLREELARVNAELAHQQQDRAQADGAARPGAGRSCATASRRWPARRSSRATRSSSSWRTSACRACRRTPSSEIARKQQAFDELVTPIRDVLQQVDLKLGEVEKNRVETGAEISSLLEAIGRSQTQLRAETTNLVRALRTPTVRGRWGEMQLRRVVEMAGMLEYCDFDEQTTHDDRDRPRAARPAGAPARRPHGGRRREGAARGLSGRAGSHRRARRANRSWPITPARCATT